MRRFLAALLALMMLAPQSAALAGQPGSAQTVLVARSHFHFGRGARTGAAPRRLHLPHIRRGFFRRILHALALAALLHFLFRTLGGILVLLLVVLLVVMLVRALLRRRRPSY
ncbi:MAG: hypothetical protein NVSMB51_21860 [Solirubrobacteraceae bacterium]